MTLGQNISTSQSAPNIENEARICHVCRLFEFHLAPPRSSSYLYCCRICTFDQFLIVGNFKETLAHRAKWANLYWPKFCPKIMGVQVFPRFLPELSTIAAPFIKVHPIHGELAELPILDDVIDLIRGACGLQSFTPQS